MSIKRVREPVNWEDDRPDNTSEVQPEDTLWPNLGRPGNWPCTVIAKSDKQYLVEATFDGMERWEMSPVYLVLNERLRVLKGSQNIALKYEFLLMSLATKRDSSYSERSVALNPKRKGAVPSQRR